jgi:hypothetical protein
MYRHGTEHQQFTGNTPVSSQSILHVRAQVWHWVGHLTNKTLSSYHIFVHIYTTDKATTTRTEEG